MLGLKGEVGSSGAADGEFALELRVTGVVQASGNFDALSEAVFVAAGVLDAVGAEPVGVPMTRGVGRVLLGGGVGSIPKEAAGRALGVEVLSTGVGTESFGGARVQDGLSGGGVELAGRLVSRKRGGVSPISP